MRVSVACVLALISSALGYQVTQPNTSEGWTDVGSQPWVFAFYPFSQKMLNKH